MTMRMIVFRRKKNYAKYVVFLSFEYNIPVYFISQIYIEFLNYNFDHFKRS